MISGEATPSLALAAYAETWVSGAKVVVVGNAHSTLAERLVERGARLVCVYDEDPSRVAEATARGRSTQVSYAALSQAGVATRDGVFDFAIVEELASDKAEAQAQVEQLSKMLSPRGVALIAVRNPEASARLLPGAAPERGGLGYYDLYDVVSTQFPETRMLGQTPFVGYAVADFGASEGDVQLDTGFLPGGAEEPELFLALASQRPIQSSFFSVVQLPLSEVRGWAKQRASRASSDGRIAELEASVKQRDEWLAGMEARATTADERADRVQSELETLKQSLDKQLRELKQDKEALQRDLAERTALAKRLDSKRQAREQDEARRDQLNAERERKGRQDAEEQLASVKKELVTAKKKLVTAQDELRGLGEQLDQERSKLEKKLEKAQSELEGVHEQVGRERSKLERELEKAQSALAKREAAEAEARQANHRAAREAQEAKQRLAELEQKLNQRQSQDAEASSELRELRQALENSRSAQGDLEAQLRERAREVARVEAEAHKMERLSRQLLVELEAARELREDESTASAAEVQTQQGMPQSTEPGLETQGSVDAESADTEPPASAERNTLDATEAPSSDAGGELLLLRERNAELSADLEAARWTIESLEDQLDGGAAPSASRGGAAAAVSERVTSPTPATPVGK